MREIALDIDEGADIIMVKPAMAYLDVVRAAAELSPVPVAAYQVSGEYAMISAAAANGWIDGRAAALETLTSIRRAGADIVLTYWAADAAGWLALNASMDTAAARPDPADVDTGVRLWLAALPLLLIGQIVDTALGPDLPGGFVAYAITGVFLVLLCAVVVTFLLLMRQGYRWARTLLTGGGLASIVYIASSLFTVQRGRGRRGRATR